MPNDAGETTQVEFETNANNNKGTLNDSGQETEDQAEVDNSSQEVDQKEPQT